MSHLVHSNTDSIIHESAVSASSISGIPFAKLHGLGNDFVLLDLREVHLAEQKTLLVKKRIERFSNRKTGVGFDQLIVLLKSGKKALAQVVFYNADGSMAEMCGNGLRAAALYCFLETENREFRLESSVGLHDCEVLSAKKNQAEIRCTMGQPKIIPTPKILKTRDSGMPEITCVDVGNPHAVVFVYPKSEREFLEKGAFLETHAAFPNRTNVQFVRMKNKTVLEARVWERGVGPTEACGTGAVACALAAREKWKLTASKIEIRYHGGSGFVHFGNKIWLEASACLVFTGLWVE